MSDIVERLREQIVLLEATGAEASDEIVRLRAERDSYWRNMEALSDLAQRYGARGDRLQEEVCELRKLLVGLGAGIPAAAIPHARSVVGEEAP